MLKKSFNFYLSPEAEKMIGASLDESNSRSRSDFVEKAIRYYAASLSADIHKEVLTRELTNAVKFNIKNSENHIAATLFKLAGEQATLNLLIADYLIGELDDNAVRTYRNAGYEIVRKRHGVFSFEDAVDDARAIAESEDK